MVEAFKEVPHVMTPLRICMNSSLRQPHPVSLSLNDCLIKGPSALVDLFTVTLCIREHRYVLTKDLSKFYQRVDADPTAQNLRRVMWRGGRHISRDEGVHHHNSQLWRQTGRMHRDSRGQGNSRNGRG